MGSNCPACGWFISWSRRYPAVSTNNVNAVEAADIVLFSVSGTLYGDCPRKHQNPYLELSASTITPLENIKNRKEPFGETCYSCIVSSSASEGTEGIDRARIHTHQVIHRIMTIIDMNEEAMNTITRLPDCVPEKLGTITKARSISKLQQRLNEHARRTDYGTAHRQSSKAKEVETISRRPDHRSRAAEPGRRSRRMQAEAKESKELSAFFTGRADTFACFSPARPPCLLVW
ncbi:hypothetical protein NEUTE2DRAFT_124321 [Neurospora tetrasperma FGSC 2509]|nr:hypothetical protein NEUTE2DRAFT_124321 [Neurospora tetrasperma FGSC 2509]